MKILQTTGGFTYSGGGTSTSTYELLSAIHKINHLHTVDILAPDATKPSDPLMGVGEDWIKAVPNDYRTPLALSKNMSSFLDASDYDIYHTNGMWMHINHSTCAIARKKGKPYIITTHGMLYPEALSRSAWKKWPMRKIWFDRDIRDAACIHATCRKEMKNIRLFGYKGPVAVIGNPVAVPDFIEGLFETRQKNHSPFRSIAFLGRLHPIKKIENILRGVALSAHKDIDIYIVGKGEPEYEDFLKKETERLGLKDRVKFLGFLNGYDKYARLAKVDALFVPSDMENFGMIIPEALIVGTPVMASLGTPWEALNDKRCGWWRDNSPESIASVINELYSLPDDERLSMGKRGRDYVLRTYAAEEVASQMLRLYQWLADKGEKPEYVFCQ